MRCLQTVSDGDEDEKKVIHKKYFVCHATYQWGHYFIKSSGSVSTIQTLWSVDGFQFSTWKFTSFGYSPLAAGAYKEAHLFSNTNARSDLEMFNSNSPRKARWSQMKSDNRIIDKSSSIACRPKGNKEVYQNIYEKIIEISFSDCISGW